MQARLLDILLTSSISMGKVAHNQQVVCIVQLSAKATLDFATIVQL